MKDILRTPNKYPSPHASPNPIFKGGGGLSLVLIWEMKKCPQPQSSRTYPNLIAKRGGSPTEVQLFESKYSLFVKSSRILGYSLFADPLYIRDGFVLKTKSMVFPLKKLINSTLKCLNTRMFSEKYLKWL